MTRRRPYTMSEDPDDHFARNVTVVIVLALMPAVLWVAAMLVWLNHKS